MKRIIAVIAVLAVGLVLCSTALAGGSVVTGHNSTPTAAGSIGTHNNQSTNAAGTLPFTGLNLATIAGGAVLLIAGGLVLRRSPRRER